MTWKFLKTKRFYGVLVALGFLIYSFWGIDLSGSWAAIRKIEPWYFIPVALGVFLMPMARAQRLKIIFEQEKEINGWRVFSVYNIAQLLNTSLPALTGQVARVLFFSKMFGLTKTFSFTMVVLEVLFDGVIVLMFVFASSSLVVLPDWLEGGETVILLACLLLFGFFYFILHRREKSAHRAPRWMYRLPRRWVREWVNISNSFLAGLQMLKSGRHLVLALVFSLASWLAHALAVFSLLYAFGFDLPFWGAIVILIINTAVIMVPISPGNLGTFQFACILGLKFFGVPKESALSFSLVLHLFETIPIVALGLYYMFSSRIQLKEYQTPEVYQEQEYLATKEYPFSNERTAVKETPTAKPEPEKAPKE